MQRHPLTRPLTRPPTRPFAASFRYCMQVWGCGEAVVKVCVGFGAGRSEARMGRVGW